MSSLTRSLLALVAIALLQGVWAFHKDAQNEVDRCARFLVGRTSDQMVVGGATRMPVHVSKRRGWVPIPQYGLIGVRVVGQSVILCNMDTRVQPQATPKGQVNSPDLKMHVYLADGKRGPANMELNVAYYLEPIYPGYSKKTHL